ncbi:MAG: class I fructose-bisphosphate aldolase [Egibacteraceae bacterium]
MPNDALVRTATLMVAAGKGILAADESIPTMSQRLEKAGVPANAETRRVYRSMIVTTPGLGEFVSGVILSDETFRQRTDGGVSIPEAAARAGILPGIKVDTGAKPLAFAEGETVTEGLDGLRDRLAEYHEMGARFAKWRAVIRIDGALPSDSCLSANAHALGRYAALCQEAGIVPIVEPEVLMDGDHSVERCQDVTERTLRRVFDELAEQRVLLEGMVLKPNMVAPGKDCAQQVTVDEVASVTVRCLRRCVPAAVPGIAFLSGGQSPERATEHLQAINSLGEQPWQLTFSYGRALLDPPLAAWKGAPSNIEAGQQALRHRADCNAAARDGRYDSSMERT